VINAKQRNIDILENNAKHKDNHIAILLKERDKK